MVLGVALGQTVVVEFGEDGHVCEVLDRRALRRRAEEPVSPVLGRFAWVPPGELTMGRDVTDGMECDTAGATPHEVELTRGVWVMEREVTQAMWERVMGYNPSAHEGCPDCPVETVSWIEAVDYAERVSRLAGVTYHRSSGP